jgi:hypothetical protein
LGMAASAFTTFHTSATEMSCCCKGDSCPMQSKHKEGEMPAHTEHKDGDKAAHAEHKDGCCCDKK